jgi:hypothetical protein
MDIGKEGTPFVIEPLVEPVPGRTAAPAPAEPDYAPVPEPVREPEKVPA